MRKKKKRNRGTQLERINILVLMQSQGLQKKIIVERGETQESEREKEIDGEREEAHSSVRDRWRERKRQTDRHT